MRQLLIVGVLPALLMLGLACTSSEEPTVAPSPVPSPTAVPPTVTVAAPTATPTSTSSALATVAATATATAVVAPTATPTVAAMTEAEPQQETEARRGDSRRGGVLRMLGVDPPTLDPALVTDGDSYEIVIELFGGLFRVTDDPNQPIVLDLAESYAISSDGTVYRFVLRDDLVFSDGSPLTAFDVKWSWERAASPKTGSPIVKEFLGDIVGIPEMIEGNANEAAGIVVVDDRTLEVTIDAPKPYFIAKLAYPITFVVSREYIESEGENWTDDPVGTGPFVLQSYEIGVSMVLARNENYWGEQAHLDEVHFNLVGGSPMAMYENDEIDVSGIPQAAFERITDPMEEISKEVVDVPASFRTSYIGFNVDEPPFDDVHFRRALNHAINKELIADVVLGNRVKPAYGPTPPGFVGFNADLEGLQFDPDKAVEELNMSAYADPEARPRIVLTVSGTGGSPPIALQAVADMWARTLEVTIEFQELEWATFLQELDNHRLQAFSLAWSPDYPDPHTFIDVLFRSDSTINSSKYSNAEVDALLDEATTEPDPARRISLYQQAEQIIVNDAVWVPMWWGTEGKILVKPQVKDFRLPAFGGYALREVWIEPEIDF